MTLTSYEPNNGVAPTVDQSSRGAARIVQWADSARAAHNLAVAICRTSFCPEQFRNKPEEATAAMLAGGEVGLSPMASLQAFDIIQGRAAARAITLRAIVLSYGHEIEMVESNERRCRMRGRRKGSEGWQEVTWTIDRAAKLKLTGKQQWQTQPTAMLVARATAEIARLVAADAILGIGYAVEELEDSLGPDTPEARRKVRRQTPTPSLPSATDKPDDDLLGDGEQRGEDAAPSTPDDDWPEVTQPPDAEPQS